MAEVMAQIVKGVAWLRAGRVTESIGQLRESIDRLHKTGHRIYEPYLRAVLADAVAREGGTCRAASSWSTRAWRKSTGRENVFTSQRFCV